MCTPCRPGCSTTLVFQKQVVSAFRNCIQSQFTLSSYLTSLISLFFGSGQLATRPAYIISIQSANRNEEKSNIDARGCGKVLNSIAGTLRKINRCPQCCLVKVLHHRSRKKFILQYYNPKFDFNKCIG